MGLVLIVVLIGLIPAAIAKAKGRSFILWWIYGMALWIVAFPHSLIMKTSQKGLDRRARAEGNKQCPYCAEMIRSEATVCRFCHREQPA